MFAEFISILLHVLTILNFLFALFVVFFERKNPSSIWAWLMVITLLPFIGFIIYMIFGFEGRKHKKFAQKAKDDEEILKKYLSRYDADMSMQNDYFYKDNILPMPNTEYLNNVVLMNIVSARSPYVTNNSVEVFHEGVSKFERLLEDIKHAKKFVHVQYYLLHDDKLGHRLMEALTEKAKEGIEVKLMYDGIGNVGNDLSFGNRLKRAGGEVGLFFPPRWIRINYRNHRKICVIDGYIGYVGGLNVGDEYVSQSKKFGFWRDSHIRIVGDAVRSLELRFIMDWNFTAGIPLKPENKYFPYIEKQEQQVGMQVLSSGPDTKWNSIQYGYFKMITEANKNLYIATPYFVPDDSILEALKTSALSGVDVRIIIPAKPDHPFVYWSSLSYLGELLEAGVRCYEYTKGFIHAKVMTMDGMITSVGTANMDVRSFKLNFETNAFIYDTSITEEFERQFDLDFEDCREITAESYAKRPRWNKIREAISRLISPML